MCRTTLCNTGVYPTHYHIHTCVELQVYIVHMYYKCRTCVLYTCITNVEHVYYTCICYTCNTNISIHVCKNTIHVLQVWHNWPCSKETKKNDLQSQDHWIS